LTADEFSAFYETARVRIISFYNNAGLSPVADDLTQEVFYSLWRGRHGITELTMTLAFTAARRIQIDHSRRHKARIQPVQLTTDHDDGEEFEVEYEEPGYRDLESDDQVTYLLSHLGTEQQRKVVSMRLQGLTHEEIGNHLGIGDDASKKTYTRGLTRLRKLVA
jgi:RNA polymerase sigma factor (sigma-70 family)